MIRRTSAILFGSPYCLMLVTIFPCGSFKDQLESFTDRPSRPVAFVNKHGVCVSRYRFLCFSRAVDVVDLSAVSSSSLPAALCPSVSVNKVGDSIRASLPIAVLLCGIILVVIHLIAFIFETATRSLTLPVVLRRPPLSCFSANSLPGEFVGHNLWDAGIALYARVPKVHGFAKI